MNNTITQLFGIKYPLVQAGMIWCSGWELASAVSNAGCLGIIGSGSMYPNVLREHIQKCQAHTDKPFAVNLPLLYPQIDDHISVIIEEDVKIVFTSAGNPAKWTSHLKAHNITVVHVVSNVKFAKKAVDAGDWEEAGNQMKDSRWYDQVTARAERLVKRMKAIKV